VWNHAYRLTGSWASAEDVTSATFLTAWRKRSDVALVRESALPWLYSVAGNLARTERRGSTRRLRLLGRLVEPPEVSAEATRMTAVFDGGAEVEATVSRGTFALLVPPQVSLPTAVRELAMLPKGSRQLAVKVYDSANTALFDGKIGLP
jgi:DNA-directed RNA polymerase specialized sigma24 family protein